MSTRDRCPHRCCDIPDNEWHAHTVSPEDCPLCDAEFDDEDEEE